MDFFDKLGKKASEAYKITADKTGRIAKETKLKIKMNELKSQISEIYEQIGKKVYEKHVLEQNISIKDDLEDECTKIDVISDEIESLLKESLSLKDKKQCTNCFTEIKKDDKFCPACGKEQQGENKKEDKTFLLEKKENKESENSNEENCDSNLQKTVEIESNVKLEEGQGKEVEEKIKQQDDL